MTINLQNYLALDFETTVETFQQPRVLTVKEYNGDPTILYRYDRDGDFQGANYKEYIESFDGIICHWAWFDLPLLQKAGIFPKNVYCTHLAEHLICGDANYEGLGLKDVVKSHCGVELNKDEQTSDWSQSLDDNQLSYALEDVNYLHTIAENQKESLLAQSQWFEFILRCKVIKSWSLDVWEGVPINESRRQELVDEALAERAKQNIFLLSKLPIVSCLPGNIKVKDLKDLSIRAKGYNSNVEIAETGRKADSKYKNHADLLANYDFESLRQYFINNPLDPILLDLGGTGPTVALLNKYGIKGLQGARGEKMDKNFLKEQLETATGEVEEIIKAIMTLRKLALIYTRYCKEGDDQIASYGNSYRMKPKISYTCTGRITLYPFSTLPREDDDKHPLENEIHKMYHPPEGYKTLSLDFCLHPKTELLTKTRGWVKVLNLNDSDEVWQVNKDTLIGSWVKPSRIIKRHYEGEIYNFKTNRGVLSVTKNHTMLWAGSNVRKNLGGEVGTVKIVNKSQDGIPGQCNIMFTSSSNKIEKKEQVISSYDIWMSTLCQADCHEIVGTKVRTFQCGLRKERKINKCVELGLQFKKYTRKTGEGDYYSRFQYDSPFLTKDKKFNLELLTEEQLPIFVEALSFWDGSIVSTKTGSFHWGSTDEDLVDEVQALLVRHGYQVRKSIRHHKNIRHKTYYSLSVQKKTSITFNKVNNLVHVEDFCGEVGCVTVPEGFILVRSEGQTFITGNCSQESIATAVFYRDSNKLKYSTEGYDPYLLLASKLFPEIDYTDPIQTKELKKKYKLLRQVAKGGELARGYVCSASKFHSVMKQAADKLGVEFPFSEDDAFSRWGELYPQLLWSQQTLSLSLTQCIQGRYSEAIQDDENLNYWYQKSGYNKTEDNHKNALANKANGVRRNFLKDDGICLVNRSITGLAKIVPLYKHFNNINAFSKKCKITDVYNFPIQSSCSSVLYLAVLLVKDFFPSIIIPVTVHDSLVCFIPDELIKKHGEENIQKAVEFLMAKAFYLVFGSGVKVDGGFTEVGLK